MKFFVVVLPWGRQWHIKRGTVTYGVAIETLFAMGKVVQNPEVPAGN